MIAHFKFLHLAEHPPLPDELVGSIRAGISDSKELLRAVAEELSFPAYFGENWNALFDCLRDFHWTDKQSIILVHQDLPNIPSDELKAYLEVLRDAAADWKAGEAHELTFIFDQVSQAAVADALGS